MIIEPVLSQWLSDFSGIANVIQQPTNKPIVGDDYIGYKILSFDHADFDENYKTAKDATFVTQNSVNRAKLLISVHTYKKGGYDALNKLKFSINSWIARNLLDTGNVSLNRSNGINNFSEPGVKEVEYHYQCDFEFFIKLENEIDIHRVNQWILNGAWSDGTENTFLTFYTNEFLVFNDNTFLTFADKNTDITSTIKYN